MVNFSVGGGCIIGGKVPDFVSENPRVVVELFGDYWHGPKLTGHSKEYEETRRRLHFAQFGFVTIIIWESELSDIQGVVRRV